MTILYMLNQLTKRKNFNSIYKHSQMTIYMYIYIYIYIYIGRMAIMQTL